MKWRGEGTKSDGTPGWYSLGYFVKMHIKTFLSMLVNYKNGR
jgi:hypothetical protein